MICVATTYLCLFCCLDELASICKVPDCAPQRCRLLHEKVQLVLWCEQCRLGLCRLSLAKADAREVEPESVLQS